MLLIESKCALVLLVDIYFTYTLMLYCKSQ